MNNFLNDKIFLQELDKQQLRCTYLKVIIMNWKEETIQEIQGRVLPGSTLNVDGHSSMRRTCNLSILVEDNGDFMNPMDVTSLFSLNKKIKIFIGVENNVNTKYNNIVWFPMGVFVVNQFSASHDVNGLRLTLSCKDKMCLLNGDIAGTLPAQVTFHEYNQMLPDGSIEVVPQLIYDIIQTVVANFGGEDLSKIIINDVDLVIKQLVRFLGASGQVLYFNPNNGLYSLQNIVAKDDKDNNVIKRFEYNDEVGYTYTNFTCPTQIVTGIGDKVTTVLDKICETLFGNFEYFYDIDGNFIFQEKKNYLNTSYDATKEATKYHLDAGWDARTASDAKVNNLDLISNDNCGVDYNTNTKYVYSFEEGNKLISAYNNNVSFTSIKNDFHVWGKNVDEQMIHYHLAIKEKPKIFNTYRVIYLKNADGEFNGRLRLALSDQEQIIAHYISNQTLKIVKDKVSINENTLKLSSLNAKKNEKTLFFLGGDIEDYIPADWRAEIYMQGLETLKEHRRPDIYQQELLDLFDIIYNFKDKEFKADIVNRPNDLKYWFDYLEPDNKFNDYSVDNLGTRMYSYQQEKINRLYNQEVPDYIIIGVDVTNFFTQEEMRERAIKSGQKITGVNESVSSLLSPLSSGYAAADTMRELLYQYTIYNKTITISSLPIYYLEPNTRIYVQDYRSNIQGDYIINSYSLALDGTGTMNIQASQAYERI